MAKCLGEDILGRGTLGVYNPNPFAALAKWIFLELCRSANRRWRLLCYSAVPSLASGLFRGLLRFRPLMEVIDVDMAQTLKSLKAYKRLSSTSQICLAHQNDKSDNITLLNILCRSSICAKIRTLSRSHFVRPRYSSEVARSTSIQYGMHNTTTQKMTL